MEPDSVYLTSRADCALTVSEACVAPESDPVCDPLLHLLELADDSDSAGYSTLSTRAVRMQVNEALLAIVATRRDAADTEPHGTNELTADSAPDKGPWQVDEWREGRGREIVLQSHDFTHDVALIVNGDFADLAEKLAYANRLAAQMNSASAPGESADPQSQGDTQ